jgi:hypothetical protein
MEINQPRSSKAKMRGFKLRSDVKWQGALKQTDIKLTDIK